MEAKGRRRRSLRPDELKRCQQLTVAALLLLVDKIWPSLVVIEQFNWLVPLELEACTDPTLDVEFGVSVNAHGMETLRWVRLRPDASVSVIEMMSSGALVPVTV